jgi:hypothetical protein
MDEETRNATMAKMVVIGGAAQMGALIRDNAPCPIARAFGEAVTRTAEAAAVDSGLTRVRRRETDDE